MEETKKESPESIRNEISALDPEALLADGWDDCILGTAYSPGRPILVVYDGDKIIEKLAQEMGYCEAEEYFSFNIEGSWMGDHTPVFVRKITT
jgi:hypothetical protein